MFQVRIIRKNNIAKGKNAKQLWGVGKTKKIKTFSFSLFSPDN